MQSQNLNKVRVVDFSWIDDPQDKAINNKNARGKWLKKLKLLHKKFSTIYFLILLMPLDPKLKEIDYDSDALWTME